MKTHKYMILGLTLVLMAIISPISAKADIGTDLRYGSKGAEVTELQEFLIDKGLLTGQATGNFFTLTRKAVVAYQTSVSLPATGFVGTMTRGKINEELALGTSAEETQSVAVVTPSIDAVAIQAKIDSLVAQIAQMNADAKATAQTQQAKTDQQTQLFGQIVQNTTPVPVVVAPVVEVKKEIKFGYIYPSSNPEIEVFYTENDEKKCDVPITLTSNTAGYFSNANGVVTTQDNATGNAGDPKGMFKNGITIKTRCWSDADYSKVGVTFNPTTIPVTFTITASTGGVSSSATIEAK